MRAAFWACSANRWSRVALRLANTATRASANTDTKMIATAVLARRKLRRMLSRLAAGPDVGGATASEPADPTDFGGSKSTGGLYPSASRRTDLIPTEASAGSVKSIAAPIILGDRKSGV